MQPLATLQTLLPLVETEGFLVCGPVAGLTDEALLELEQALGAYRIETNADNTLNIVGGTGGRTGRINALITRLLVNWAEAAGTGYVFDSSTNFRFSPAVVRSPDAAWVRKERFDALTTAQQEGFPPLCPDFVLEIRSKSDRIGDGSIRDLLPKMEEYLAFGVRLAWLLDPIEQTVYIHRPGQPHEVVTGFDRTLSGEDVLPGFELPLSSIK
ncbi:MAG: Uma2 family endonuclease [Bacteroidia bacterium]|nr:Uma2 family endonuclease [Bacteroidia bacterium]